MTINKAIDKVEKAEIHLLSEFDFYLFIRRNHH
jgi:hypothetical protein